MRYVISVMLLCIFLLFAEPYQSDEFMLSGWSTAAGMGELCVVRDWDALSASANPALLTEIHNFSIAVSGGSFFSNLINAARFGAVIGDGDFKYGAAAQFIGGGNIFITELENPDVPLSADNRPYIVGEESHYTASLDIAAAKVWRNISAGTSMKLVRKKIPDVSAWGFALSCGALWKPIKGLNTGVFIENVSTYQLFWNDDVRETGMPEPKAGASYEFNPYETVKLSVALEGEYSFDSGSGIFHGGVAGTYADIVTFSIGSANGSLCTAGELTLKMFTIGASLDYRSAIGASYSFSLGYSPKPGAADAPDK